MEHYQILPSILSADAGKLIEETRTVDISGIEYLHIDVMDGHFVPNLTLGPAVVKSLKKHTRFKLDVHLMITNPTEMVPVFADAGADIITIHQEAVNHLHRQIYQIKDLGLQAGVSLNPATPVETLSCILSDIDLVLIMSVNPGFGAQKFITNSLQKVSELYRLTREKSSKIIIEVDGGIDPTNAGKLFSAGARFLVAGNSIFGQPDRPKAIAAIHESIYQASKRQASRKV